jgi:hypothetical protein
MIGMLSIESLPESIRNSNIFSNVELGQLSNIDDIPFVDATFEDDTLKNVIQYYSVDPDEMERELHLYARKLLQNGKVYEAWQVLLTNI